MFEIKDKLGQGIEYRMTRFWPEQFKNSKLLKQVLAFIETKEMKENKVNSLSLIFQKVVQQDLIK